MPEDDIQQTTGRENSMAQQIKSVRLSDARREQIKRTCINDLFDEVETKLFEQKKVIAESVLKQALPEGFHPSREQFNWFENAKYLTVFDGHNEFFEYDFRNDDVYRPVPHFLIRNYSSRAAVSTDTIGSAILKSIKKWKADKEAHDKKKALIEWQIDTVLYGVNTSKQLLEVWPEGKKYFEFLLVDNVQKIMPPAIITDELNKMIAAVSK